MNLSAYAQQKPASGNGRIGWRPTTTFSWMAAAFLIALQCQGWTFTEVTSSTLYLAYCGRC